MAVEPSRCPKVPSMAAFTEAKFPAPAQGAVRHDDVARHRIGPNAIIQTRMALRELTSDETCRAIFVQARLYDFLDRDPAGMVDERQVAALFLAIGATLSPAEAGRVLRQSGRLTGHYIWANRIPPLARRALRILPSAIASRVLLRAIAAHAWTFAGSGSVRVEMWPACAVRISANPIATPGCAWHLGVFETLFGAFAGSPVRVRHTACCSRGDGHCRTVIG